jgi:hypothetical protein
MLMAATSLSSTNGRRAIPTGCQRSPPNWFGNNEAIDNTDRIYLMRVNGNKLIIKSPGVIVPVTGAPVWLNLGR